MFVKLDIFLIIVLIKMLFNNVYCSRNKYLGIINKGMRHETDPCSVGLLFSVDLNNTSGDVMNVEIKGDQCCLENGDNVDCNLFDLIGCADNIPRDSSKTITLIAPLIEPFNRKGYCLAHVDSWSDDRRKMRDPIKLEFDTKSIETNLNGPINICTNIDEDPLNDCKPVNCDVYYNGGKPLYDEKSKRCVEAKDCLIDTLEVLNPNTNECVDNRVNDGDMDFLKSLVNNSRKSKDVLIIKNVRRPMTDKLNISSLLNDELKSHEKKKKTLKTVKVYFYNNKYTFGILGIVILVQCLLICTMFFFVTKNCACCKKKKVERKYFNYRQDASVTTPLIGTSNIDTETTDYQYLSESSNVDQKIKCYKACQKERKNNVKLCMSDDILSKCLNRRDWIKHKSETIPESPKEDVFKSKFDNKVDIEGTSRKSAAADVKFEVETMIDKPKPNVTNEKDTKMVKIMERKIDAKQTISSEKELKCHTYNCTERNSNIKGFLPSTTHSKTFGYYQTGNDKRGTISLSTEKSAQASFSNDSIDDFLSERGAVFLAGENMSKYSLTSSSNLVKSSISSASSRTSKNNVMKNVLSLLKWKSKGPSSDPGLKKTKQSIDLELIHMSRASVFSSSNDSDCKGFKRLKDSRTSL